MIEPDPDIMLNNDAICEIIRLYLKNQGLEYENVRLISNGPVQIQVFKLKKDKPAVSPNEMIDTWRQNMG